MDRSNNKSSPGFAKFTPWHEIACSENEMSVSEMDLLISNANNEGLEFCPRFKSFAACFPDYCKYYGSQVTQGEQETGIQNHEKVFTNTTLFINKEFF